MNTAEERFEQIERYLANRLGTDERAAFEAALAADPALATDVQRQRKERQALELLVEADLFAKMRAWDAEPAAETPVRSLDDWYAARGTTADTPPREGERPGGLWIAFRKIPLAARAAAAALLLAVAGWLVLRDRTALPTTEAPIAKATEPVRPQATPKPPARQTRPNNNPPAQRPRPQNQGGGTQRAPTTPARPPQNPSTGPAVTQGPTTTPPPANPPSTATTLRPAAYASLADEFYRENDFQAVSSSPGASSGRSGLDKLQSQTLDQATRQFRGGSYAQAEKLLQPILRLNPNSTGAKELLAHALYRQGRYRQALPYFRQLANAGGVVGERAQWALVLTAMHDMPRQQSVVNSTLSRIVAQPGHRFNTAAKSLAARIKR